MDRKDPVEAAKRLTRSKCRLGMPDDEFRVLAAHTLCGCDHGSWDGRPLGHSQAALGLGTRELGAIWNGGGCRVRQGQGGMPVEEGRGCVVEVVGMSVIN